MSSPLPVKLGILSTATIATRIVEALEPISIFVCTVVASRSIDRAKAFAAKHDIPLACTYEQLLEQPVDAIYIPLPTALATDWAVRFASAGYHVLVDKPFDSAEGLQRILEACEQNNVYFMDGTHYVHATRTMKVAERVRAGELGDVKRIVTLFAMPSPLAGNIRSDPKLEPMGAIGDLGWYVMRSVVAFLGVDVAANVLSIKCVGKYHKDYEGSVESAEGVVEFGANADSRKITLCFAIDCNCSATQQVRIMGTRGCIDVLGFVDPRSQTGLYSHLRKPGQFTTDLEILTTKSVADVDNAGNPVWIFPVTERETIQECGNMKQISMMLREFSRMILEKDTDASRKWAQESLATQKLVDAVFEEFKMSAS